MILCRSQERPRGRIPYEYAGREHAPPICLTKANEPMSTTTTTQQLHSKPEVIALTGIQTSALAAEATSPLDALRFANQQIVLTKDVCSASSLALHPTAFTQALISELKSTARPGPLVVFCEGSVLGKALKNSLGLFPTVKYRLVDSLPELRSLDQRSIIVDATPRGHPQLRERRHLAGSPLVCPPPWQTIPRILIDAVAVQRLSALNDIDTSSQPEKPRLQLMQTGSIMTGRESSLLLSADVFKEMAHEYNRETIPPETPPSETLTGFLTRYDAADFARMAQRPGCVMNLITFGNSVLGYIVGYTDPDNLPLHGQRLKASLDAVGLLPNGRVGFCDLLHVTDAGKRYGQAMELSFYDLLHDNMIQAAQANGLTHMVCQTREYPFPNTIARKVHAMHGWLDTGVSMLYPYKEGSNGWEYILARVHLKELRTSTSSKTGDQSKA